MTSNPIIAVVANEAAANDWPISGVTVIAPLISGQALLAINWQKFEPGDGLAGCDIPKGVSVSILKRVPETILPLPPMADTETQVIAAAWSLGAWDIKRTAMEAGYSGQLPPYAAGIDAAVRRQGYVAWYWRPMMRGPEIRATANGHRDATLNKWSLGRDGAPPEISTLRLAPNRQHMIKLGRDNGARRQSMPAATDKQRHYLARLLRDAGEDEALPDDLDKRHASAWIDRLTGEAPPEPSAKARKRSIAINASQWRLIDHLRRRLGHPCISPQTMRTMFYDEAAAMIKALRREP